MRKPVVLIADALSPATAEALGSAVDVRHCNGTDREELLRSLPAADAVLVRSATRIDRAAIAAGRNLTMIARAGVGVDNIDVKAATEAGVMVVNAPSSNSITAAELTCGLLIATARNIPQADVSLRAGQWERKRFAGTELHGKTLGIIGLGRIGRLVADRMAAFGMKVVAHDPYLRGPETQIELLPLDTLLRDSDFISVHLPKTPETTGLIGDRALGLVKPTVRIVNVARGGIIDEEALATALKEERVAAAGLDVFATEPCTDSPLFAYDNVVVTPHLGASTAEAQDKAGVDVARSVRRGLAGEPVPEALNLESGPIDDTVRPLVPLAESLGAILRALSGGVHKSLRVEIFGEAIRHNVKTVELSALKGYFAQEGATRRVSLVNAPELARRHEVSVRLLTSSENAGDRQITLAGIAPDGQEVSVSGTLSGLRNTQRITEVCGHEIDLEITDHMLFLHYEDMPGVIGAVGRILAESGVNIGSMQVTRAEAGGEAMVALTLDSSVPDTLLSHIADSIGATSARFVRVQSPV